MQSDVPLVYRLPVSNGAMQLPMFLSLSATSLVNLCAGKARQTCHANLAILLDGKGDAQTKIRQPALGFAICP
jgi:hypothetical protein